MLRIEGRTARIGGWGAISRVQVALQDVTERRHIEEQLRRSQRPDAGVQLLSKPYRRQELAAKVR